MGMFCKKVDLSSTQGALYTVSVFFIVHFTYLGGVYAANAQGVRWLRTGQHTSPWYLEVT